MTKKIIFEVMEESKRELSEYLKKSGYSGKHVEMLEIHFHPTGEISFVKPRLRF